MMDIKDNELLKELDLLDFPFNEVGFPTELNPAVNLGLSPFTLHRPVYRRFSFQHDFGVPLTDIELDEQLFGAFYPEPKPLVDYVPAITRTKRGRVCKLEAEPSKKRKLAPLVTDSDLEKKTNKYKTKQKRTKWMKDEVLDLWQGIATFGNNWRLIKKKSFGHRTYYQVKDKGRRILSSKGWSSGRTKATHDGAAEEAKIIAESMLVSLGAPLKSQESTSDVISNVGSTGTPSVTSESDFEFEV